MSSVGDTGEVSKTINYGPAIAKRIVIAMERAKANGATWESIAEAAHTTKTTLSTLRRGGAGSAQLKTLLFLAQALGVDPVWLIFGPERGASPEQ